ncbi:GMC oxidoreductase-domain-containing protein [Diplogelasinospora grovesii]|uniref:GMC oxidoreductase-domain-containing protein n=1 Tax=Diplogelasinospora grovesii TaxID=303347 RepID=A0AAN6NC43_9PEZI|nr:GMC oxidoreductase-domain-containing protein [Diplogelasinospora grovesii]
MAISNKLPEDLDEVDIIIAGGGTAGCIVAARLAAADPSLSILVIEGGTNNYNVPNVIHPALFTQNLLPGSKTAIFYQGNRAKQLANRDPVVPSGGILGGGSSINFMLYTRAQRMDFDSWKMPGWSTKELIPFLKKLETYHGPGTLDTHGTSGPVHISDGGFRCKRSEDDILQATAAMGYPEINDVQDLDSNDGFQRWLRTVSPEGRRQDTAHAYLHPLLQQPDKYPNLHVLVEHKVVRILFSPSSGETEPRAVGVEITPNPDYHATIIASQPKPKTQVIRARKLVVLSCGACGSPPTLERSGIGSAEVLKRAGVPVVVDLPGVGRDYQDHNLNLIPYRTNLKADETCDELVSGRLTHTQALEQGNPTLKWNGCDVASKVRPTEKEVDELGPEFRKKWDKDFKDKPNRPIMLIAFINSYFGDHSTVPLGGYMTTGIYTAYPYSRGHIHITGPNLTDPLDFDVGFFTDEGDVDIKKLVWAYKKQREIMRRTSMYRGEVASGHPRFAADSAAACVEFPVDSPNPLLLESVRSRLENTAIAPIGNGLVNGSGGVKDIPYTPEDDAAIEQYLRETTNTTWHSLGTCKMAPREELGVVDASLSVYGVKGLKIVDLSIPPENVAANTNNSAMVIGERGADIIARELGIAGWGV